MMESTLQGFILALSFSFDITKVVTISDLAKGKFLLTKKKMSQTEKTESDTKFNSNTRKSLFFSSVAFNLWGQSLVPPTTLKRHHEPLMSQIRH